jgi:hypothetical protein
VAGTALENQVCHLIGRLSRSLEGAAVLMKLSQHLMADVEAGRKTSTIRSGVRTEYKLGTAVFMAGKTQLKVFVWRLSIARFEKLTEAHARRENYNTVEELHSALLGFYPDLTLDSLLTVVDFQLHPPKDAAVH